MDTQLRSLVLVELSTHQTSLSHVVLQSGSKQIQKSLLSKEENSSMDRYTREYVRMEISKIRLAASMKHSSQIADIEIESHWNKDLTQEQRVAILIGEGKTIDQIASELNLGRRRVEKIRMSYRVPRKPAMKNSKKS